MFGAHNGVMGMAPGLPLGGQGLFGMLPDAMFAGGNIAGLSLPGAGPVDMVAAAGNSIAGMGLTGAMGLTGTAPINLAALAGSSVANLGLTSAPPIDMIGMTGTTPGTMPLAMLSLGTAQGMAQGVAPKGGSKGGTAKGSKDPKGKGRDSNPPEKVFVGGLPNSATEARLRQYFEQFGKVASVQLKYHDCGLFKGFGFIFFEDKHVASRVCSKKGHQFDGKPIDCRRPMGATSSTQTDSNCKVFVGGLPKNSTTESVEKYFEDSFGRVASLQLKYDAEGSFRGFAFLTFEQPDAAERCCNTKGQCIEGKAIHCQAADPEVAVEAHKRVFIGGLLKTATEEEIFAQFSKFGKVTNIEMKWDGNGKFRGFCYITFADRSSAETVYNLQKEEAALYENDSGNSNAPLMFQRCITMSGTVGSVLNGLEDGYNYKGAGRGSATRLSPY